uniref:Uncharacterized protein n=1 Tax=Anguilla anguilla TaxID=7936 RepID=A0A0E9UVW8_ANGAN
MKITMAHQQISNNMLWIYNSRLKYSCMKL